jgi:intracellular sulfur oxidation DsrE/DsrF family protein
MDETGGIKIYDVDGNEVALNVNGKYRINVVGHGSSMKIMGADALSNRITALQAKLNMVLYCESSFKCLPLYLTKVPLSS